MFEDNLDDMKITEYEVNAALWGEFPDDRPIPTLRDRVGYFFQGMKLAASEIIISGLKRNPRYKEFDGVELSGESSGFHTEFYEYLDQMPQKED